MFKMINVAKKQVVCGFLAGVISTFAIGYYIFINLAIASKPQPPIRNEFQLSDANNKKFSILSSNQLILERVACPEKLKLIDTFVSENSHVSLYL